MATHKGECIQNRLKSERYRIEQLRATTEHLSRGSADQAARTSQVATATDEMTATSEQVSRDIEQIHGVSCDTSLTADQTAQAVHSLTALSENLQKMVGEFKL